MASNSSGSLAPGASYTLGEYTFTLSNVVSEGERVLQAHCSGPEGNAAGGISVSTSDQLQSWSVEADETEATVYAKIKSPELNTGDVPVPVPAASSLTETYQDRRMGTNISAETTVTGGVGTIAFNSNIRAYIYAARESGAYYAWIDSEGDTGGGSLSNTFTYNGKTVYYASSSDSTYQELSAAPSITYSADFTRYAAAVAWTMIYGVPASGESENFISRFPIDLREAGGGSWQDPGDTGYGTLHLTVTGALSGRHNDPTASAEGAEFYSHVPADNAKEAWYGCGGDGGYGGGGGAGASTIIINEFPTSRAGNKELVANARRHGYGSGGGKGGNGGDGCILIYYSTPVPPNP
ncbi:MAG: hypothetical protein K6C12_03270 [Oscillospiraceae bacterium]|nr:hypothetical protein [Oscillospiraceae bacterium]